MLDILFGRRKTPAEMLRQHKRSLDKAQRELDRERIKLEAQEKKLIADIKKAAKANQMGACKVMAKDLVRTRRYVQKFYAMKTQLQAVGLRIQTLRSNQQMTEAMKGATKAMASMNRTMNLPALQKIMMDFERESEMMDMKEDMMGDAIDDVMEEEEDDQESEEIVNKVLDEIGISLDQELANTPTELRQSAPAAKERVAQAEGAGGIPSEDDALQAPILLQIFALSTCTQPGLCKTYFARVQSNDAKQDSAVFYFGLDGYCVAQDGSVNCQYHDFVSMTPFDINVSSYLNDTHPYLFSNPNSPNPALHPEVTSNPPHQTGFFFALSVCFILSSLAICLAVCRQLPHLHYTDRYYTRGFLCLLSALFAALSYGLVAIHIHYGVNSLNLTYPNLVATVGPGQDLQIIAMAFLLVASWGFLKGCWGIK
ncbi:hypothetical protein BZG36_05054 [Bifiguratus adelaidae]|uniref:Uncharacterized protein n=1 Tax=Bifiguratus adelaidae TaxID=1938954 RepID=A0A261XYR0_9FUNG|nr:hypothetical protein BZG36_05054 [Bifiguratus adelaidae]